MIIAVCVILAPIKSLCINLVSIQYLFCIKISEKSLITNKLICIPEISEWFGVRKWHFTGPFRWPWIRREFFLHRVVNKTKEATAVKRYENLKVSRSKPNLFRWNKFGVKNICDRQCKIYLYFKYLWFKTDHSIIWLTTNQADYNMLQKDEFVITKI